jgi:hypothetical protein
MTSLGPKKVRSSAVDVASVAETRIIFRPMVAYGAQRLVHFRVGVVDIFSRTLSGTLSK